MLGIPHSPDHLADFNNYHYQLAPGVCRVSLKGSGIGHVSARPVQNGKAYSVRTSLFAESVSGSAIRIPALPKISPLQGCAAGLPMKAKREFSQPCLTRSCQRKANSRILGSR